MPSITGITNEELVELIRSGSKENIKDLYAQLYQQNYPIIHDISRRYSGGNIDDMNDYEQEAFFGLVYAVDKYDKTKGKFITYAQIFIKSIIQRYIENNGKTVRLPSYLIQQIMQYNRYVQRYITEKGHKPDDDELKRALDLSSERLMQLKNTIMISEVRSLDKVISAEDDTFSLSDIVSDPVDRIDKVSEGIDSDNTKKILWEEVDSLDDSQAKVIHKRYEDNETLSSISTDMNISRDRVKQIENNALNCLRQSERIERYRDDYISSVAYHGSGIASFRKNGSSSTEKVAIRLYERDIEANKRRCERQILRIAEQKGVSFEDGYAIYLMEKYRDILSE